MKLSSRPILVFLSDPLRRALRGFTLRDSGLAVRGGARSWIGFEEIASRPATENGFLSSSLALALTGGAQVALPAVRSAAASSFAEAVGDAWSEFNLRALAAEEGTIQRLLRLLDALRAPERYPSACHLDPLASEAVALTNCVLSKLNAEVVGPETMRRIAPNTAFAADPGGAREAAIERFTAAQLDRWKEIFDTVESMFARAFAGRTTF